MHQVMKVFLLFVLASIFQPLSLINAQDDASINIFWEQFRAAVIKEDKLRVASLTRFPVSMPYGVPDVRNKTQLIKRYRKIFFFEHNAPACFREAKPMKTTSPTRFEIACKNEAGDEVIIYSFTRTRNGWRFTGLDNINE